MLQKIATCEYLSLDTESLGPSLPTRDKFLNVYASTVLGFSFCLPDKTSYYCPVSHPVKNVSEEHVRKILQAMQGKRVVFHNAKHDLRVLSQQYGSLSSYDAEDTLILAWLNGEEKKGLKSLAKSRLGRESPEFKALDLATPEETAFYACSDALNTLELYDYYLARTPPEILEEYRTYELPFIRVLLDMENAGMRYDVTASRRLRKTLEAAVRKLYAEWDQHMPLISPTSGAQLQALFTEGLWATGNVTPSGLYSTDHKTMKDIANTAEGLGKRLAEIRVELSEYNKLISGFMSPLEDLAAVYQDGRIHPSYGQTGTATGRLSCNTPNLMNIPAHGENGKLLKSCFVPAEGKIFVSADYSQIELRVLAHFCGGSLAQAYKRGADVHQETADSVGCSRQQGKTLVFATVYGAGNNKVAELLGESRDVGNRFIKKFKDSRPEVFRLKRDIIRAASDRDPPYVRTLLGRRRYLEDMGSWGDQAKAFNTVIQGGAADICKLAMLLLHKELGAEATMISQVHDEITLEVPNTSEAIDHYTRTLTRCMKDAYKLNVPIEVDAKEALSWDKTK